jgi:hypothetical protein
MTIAVETLTRILVFFLYFPACPILYWWLVRRLPSSYRLLAALLLAAQLVVVGVALLYAPASLYEDWLWHLDEEWNIPSMLSSAQLALVGAVAFIASWRAKRQSAWYCAVTAGYGFLFLAIAFVEFTGTKTSAIGPWYFPYLVLGGGLAAGTLLPVKTAHKPERRWLHYLLMAIALIGLAGVVLDEYKANLCDSFLGLFRYGGCIPKYAVEEVMEFIGGWVALAAILGQLSEYERRASAPARWMLFLFPAFWILLVTQLYTPPPISQQSGAQSASLVYASGAKLHAYALMPGDSNYTFHLYLSSPPKDFNSQGYSVHIIDPISRESLASHDKILNDSRQLYTGPGYTPVYLQSIRLTIPADAPRNHALWAVLTLWRADGAGFLAQEIQSSDLRRLGDSQIILGEIVLPAQSSPPPPSAPLAYFENGFTLDPVSLPKTARAGATLSLPFTWRANLAGNEEYAQFLHLGDEASAQWWIFDQQPLGPRLPTQYWYAGLADQAIWNVLLPADIPAGQYSLFTGLYRARDKERLPASDSDGSPFVDARVPLGHLNIAERD